METMLQSSSARRSNAVTIPTFRSSDVAFIVIAPPGYTGPRGTFETITADLGTPTGGGIKGFLGDPARGGRVAITLASTAVGAPYVAPVLSRALIQVPPGHP